MTIAGSNRTTALKKNASGATAADYLKACLTAECEKDVGSSTGAGASRRYPDARHFRARHGHSGNLIAINLSWTRPSARRVAKEADVHDGAPNSGLLHIILRPGESVQEAQKRPRIGGFGVNRCRCQTVPRLVATHPVPISVTRPIGNRATSSLFHLPIGNAVTGGDQRFQIEHRGQYLQMLLHLGAQLLQRRALAERWLDRVLIELNRRQPMMPVGCNFL